MRNGRKMGAFLSSSVCFPQNLEMLYGHVSVFCETVWSFAAGMVIQLLIWATSAPGVPGWSCIKQ